jgi:hypothetical protein
MYRVTRRAAAVVARKSSVNATKTKTAKSTAPTSATNLSALSRSSFAAVKVSTSNMIQSLTSYWNKNSNSTQSDAGQNSTESARSGTAIPLTPILVVVSQLLASLYLVLDGM